MKQKEHIFFEKHPTIKHVYLNYKYDQKKGIWNFVGYRCTMCGTVFKRETTFPGHIDNCRPTRLIEKDRENEAKIVSLCKKDVQ